VAEDARHDTEQRLLSSSDEVLRAAGELREVERRKRLEKVSTEEFHRLADISERMSRQIFRAAAEETDAADELPSGSSSIEEIAAEREGKSE